MSRWCRWTKRNWLITKTTHQQKLTRTSWQQSASENVRATAGVVYTHLRTQDGLAHWSAKPISTSCPWYTSNVCRPATPCRPTMMLSTIFQMFFQHAVSRSRRVVCRSMVPFSGTPTCCMSIVCEVSFPKYVITRWASCVFEDQNRREHCCSSTSAVVSHLLLDRRFSSHS